MCLHLCAHRLTITASRCPPSPALAPASSTQFKKTCVSKISIQSFLSPDPLSVRINFQKSIKQEKCMQSSRIACSTSSQHTCCFQKPYHHWIRPPYPRSLPSHSPLQANEHSNKLRNTSKQYTPTVHTTLHKEACAYHSADQRSIRRSVIPQR